MIQYNGDDRVTENTPPLHLDHNIIERIFYYVQSNSNYSL